MEIRDDEISDATILLGIVVAFIIAGVFLVLAQVLP